MPYDTIILGTGAAGYAAALYTGRYQLKTLVIGKNDGGMTALAHEVENYPGIETIKGFELMQKFRKHVEKFGAEILIEEAKKIEKNPEGFTVTTAKGEKYEGTSLICTIGTERRKLEVPGEKELHGKGVSYCTTCDGFFFRGKTVMVVGGGDAALTGALYLGDIGKKVYVIIRRNVFRAEPVTIKKVEEHPKIEIIYSNVIKKIKGDPTVKEVVLDKPHKESNNVSVDGVFIEIGAIPNTDILKNQGVDLDETGFIKISPNQSTNIPGLFAAGDITTGSNSFHQIITAAAEGVIAANGVFNYLKSK